jgi:hypothetical protein
VTPAPAEEYDPFESDRADPPDPAMLAYMAQFASLPLVDAAWGWEEYGRRYPDAPRITIALGLSLVSREDFLVAEENLRRRRENERRAAIPEWP